MGWVDVCHKLIFSCPGSSIPTLGGGWVWGVNFTSLIHISEISFYPYTIYVSISDIFWLCPLYFEIYPQFVESVQTGRKVPLLTFVWLFPSVHFKKCLQSTCVGRYIITLITFVLIVLHCAISNVSSNGQLEWMHCIATLVAFVWLFSTVCFQMSLQITCSWRGKVALVTFVFSRVFFQTSFHS